MSQPRTWWPAKSWAPYHHYCKVLSGDPVTEKRAQDSMSYAFLVLQGQSGPVLGRMHVARFFLGVRHQQPPKAEHVLVRVNGEDAVVTYEAGRPVAVMTTAAHTREIEALYVIDDRKY